MNTKRYKYLLKLREEVARLRERIRKTDDFENFKISKSLKAKIKNYINTL